MCVCVCVDADREMTNNLKIFAINYLVTILPLCFEKSLNK
jgi:hypothetical protein